MNHKQNKKPAFTVQNVLDLVRELMPQKNTWKNELELFKKVARSRWDYIFVQENPVQQMVQIVYMHQQITKNMSRQQVLAVTRPHPVHAMTIHVPTVSLVHCFGPKPYVYECGDIQQFVDDTLFFANDVQEIAYELIPHSFMFAIRWFNDQWYLGGQSIMIANDVKFGSEKTLYEEFLRLYGEEPLAQLDKTVIHVFRLSSNQYMPVAGVEGVWILETRNGQTGQLIVDYNFTNRQSYARKDISGLLFELTDLSQQQAVAYHYEQTRQLTASVMVSMGQYLIQMDSCVQRLSDQCVKEKRYMKQFMLESDDPFAVTIRDIADHHAEHPVQAQNNALAQPAYTLAQSDEYPELGQQTNEHPNEVIQVNTDQPVQPAQSVQQIETVVEQLPEAHNDGQQEQELSTQDIQTNTEDQPVNAQQIEQQGSNEPSSDSFDVIE